MRLYLMRHGQAEAPDDGSESELTATGRITIGHQAERFVALLENDAITLQQIYHSGKKRAAQTAAIVGARLVPTLEPQFHDGMKPNDDPGKLLEELQHLQQPTLLVSHLPFIPTLVRLLSNEPLTIELETIPAGTLIALQRDSNSWHITSILTPRPSFQLAGR